jgi:hypothetical protein
MRRYAVSASVLTVALTLGLPMPPLASIISGSILSGGPGATFVKLTVPFLNSTPANTLGEDNFQTVNLYGFDEDQNILLVGPLVVDAVPSGSTTLPIGTTVASQRQYRREGSRSSTQPPCNRPVLPRALLLLAVDLWHQQFFPFRRLGASSGPSFHGPNSRRRGRTATGLIASGRRRKPTEKCAVLRRHSRSRQFPDFNLA